MTISESNWADGTQFELRAVAGGQVWIDMLDHRNLLSHTYDSAVFEEAVDAIAQRYIPAMEKLDAFFAARISE